MQSLVISSLHIAQMIRSSDKSAFRSYIFNNQTSCVLKALVSFLLLRTGTGLRKASLRIFLMMFLNFNTDDYQQTIISQISR
jgi:hypothetical protein